MKIAVLGAGLTGVELGRQLRQLGKDFVLFEKESQIGGICKTNKTGDYYWDFAVHALYSQKKEAMDYFHSLPLDYQYLNRNVKVFHSGGNGRRHILDYPFEIGIKDMPLGEKLECITGYIAARIKRVHDYSNLERWINNCLGSGIARHFMTPYNNKIWNCKLSEISNRLVSSKIDPSPLSEFILNIFGKKTIGRTYQAKFIYPKKGIQELVDHLAKDIKDKILLKSNIEKLIRKGNKWIIVTDGRSREEADIVVSTIPLVELLKKISIDGIEAQYNELKWNNTFFVMIGLKKDSNFKIIKDCHWVFFKEKEIFYRLTLMHNFSSGLLPTLVAEVTQKGDILSKSKEEIEKIIIKDLIRLGILTSQEDIAQTDTKLLEYTYPIPTLGLENVKNRISTILERHNLFLLGRNGNWDYINMDGVILKVKEFIAKFLINEKI